MDSESGTSGSTKKALIIVFSILGGFALLCVLSCVGLGIWAIKKYGDLPQVAVSAETFADNLAAGSIDAAYAQTSQAFQQKQTLEDFKALIQRYPTLMSPAAHNLSNLSMTETPNGQQAQIQEIVSGPKGSHTVSLTLIKEDGQWKVDNISVR